MDARRQLFDESAASSSGKIMVYNPCALNTDVSLSFLPRSLRCFIFFIKYLLKLLCGKTR